MLYNKKEKKYFILVEKFILKNIFKIIILILVNYYNYNMSLKYIKYFSK